MSTDAAEPALLAEERDFLVVAKPPHLLSHPTKPDGSSTLLGWLQARFPGEFLALVNRLDRETSGVILVARSTEAASRFGAMTMRREIQKTYVAFVNGRVEEEHGLIDAPIGRLGISEDNPIWLRQGVIAPGDVRKSAAARTEYWVLAAADSCSCLKLRAHTGRLHQLRVHLASIGHPVIGDKVYGPDPALYLKFIVEGWTDEHQRVLGLERHALHAAELAFSWKDQDCHYRSSMPEDMRQYARRAGLPRL
jgi:23S rRNA pseudouridine1911/1915/1917 synthase